LPPEEIEAAVSLEASQVCPFNAADSAVDHQLIPDGDDKTRGILVAATNSLIKSKVQLAKEAYLKCVLVDVDGLALLNCFNGLNGGYDKSQTGRPIAILNVGGSCTTLAIMGDNGWPFIRDMTYAGDDIIKQLATECDMSTKAVKGILSGGSPAGGQGSPTPQTELCNSLKKACQKLIVDVAETLRYYMAQEKSALVDKMLVCGGFAPAKGFVELLNSQLPVEAVLWNPFDDKIRCDAGQLCKDTLAKAGPAMAVAAGLAMRAI
jgi:type IV pilus assembly protein PilM